MILMTFNIIKKKIESCNEIKFENIMLILGSENLVPGTCFQECFNLIKTFIVRYRKISLLKKKSKPRRKPRCALKHRLMIAQ